MSLLREDVTPDIGVGAMTLAGSEVACAQCDLRHAQAGLPKHCVFHSLLR